jgi:hypothetical protein
MVKARAKRVSSGALDFLSYRIAARFGGLHSPSMGAAVSQPLSADDISKSHVADGSTNEMIVMPTAVFK